jgi:hypothetical protein
MTEGFADHGIDPVSKRRRGYPSRNRLKQSTA